VPGGTISPGEMFTVTFSIGIARTPATATASSRYESYRRAFAQGNTDVCLDRSDERSDALDVVSWRLARTAADLRR
jgi:hypothetical protein